MAERAAQGPHPRQRLVYDGRCEKSLPGVLVRREGQPNGADGDVDRAYEMAGRTLDFYADVLGRDSIDDRGMAISSTVHFGKRYQNAFWNGAQMVYGDGDGEAFESFTTCLEIAAHELAHGVTQIEAALAYHGESGALSESISDVFGSLVKQHALRQAAAKADWIIGAGIFGLEIAGVGLRSLAAPGSAYDDPLLGGRDPQPSHMRDYASDGPADALVHINSGIPNHAFYLFATALGGYAWEIGGRVWYDALRSGLDRESGFRSFAGATTEAAKAHGVRVVDAARQAWADVGIIAR
ncbi:MAG TPA: M4 family metallopeptidase [Candidatus Elarobacter sp.]|nr:M4 family metallopeptidase [Candidatus Elarobacter sp.]